MIQPDDRVFADSPDVGTPACICSRCGAVIDGGVIDGGVVLIRLFMAAGDGEYRYHPQCFSRDEVSDDAEKSDSEKSTPTVWSRIEIDETAFGGEPNPNIHGRGPVVVTCMTNDNDDNGVPGPIEQWQTRHPTIEAALAVYGRSRVGWAGHQVHVFVNGQQV